jgi:hypothetical protein
VITYDNKIRTQKILHIFNLKIPSKKIFRDISHQAFSDFSIAAAGRVGRYLQLQGEVAFDFNNLINAQKNLNNQKIENVKKRLKLQKKI